MVANFYWPRSCTHSYILPYMYCLLNQSQVAKLVSFFGSSQKGLLMVPLLPDIDTQTERRRLGGRAKLRVEVVVVAEFSRRDPLWGFYSLRGEEAFFEPRPTVREMQERCQTNKYWAGKGREGPHPSWTPLIEKSVSHLQKKSFILLSSCTVPTVQYTTEEMGSSLGWAHTAKIYLNCCI